MTSNTTWTKTALTLNSTSKVVELPTRYTLGSTYRFDDKLSFGAQFKHGLSRTEFNLGAEYPWWFFELRGGMRYLDPKWSPAAGVGLKMGDKVAFDLAAYGTTSNIESARKTAIVASFRVNH